MSLSRFILENSERILAEWEAFARTIVPLDSMDIAALRDHASGMLHVIAEDLERPRTGRERSDQSKGLSDAGERHAETPAQAHGAGRAESGFTFEQMLSEYRAVRASVIRLWTEEKGQLVTADIEDLMRFNEAIDQALAESTSRFSEDLDYTRQIFLGILGHDLRTPLSAMITSAQFMLELRVLEPPADMLAARIVTSGERMGRMIDDLLDFTLTQLGASIPVVPEQLDLKKVLEDAVEEAHVGRPDANVVLRLTGDLSGEWDAARLSQVFSNLLSNAISYGSKRAPIEIDAEGHPDVVVVHVRNEGHPIPRDRMARLFDPMKPDPGSSRDSEHLGLGLYIVERVVSAHHGTVGVRSDQSGTTFTVSLPRRIDVEAESQGAPRAGHGRSLG